MKKCKLLLISLFAIIAFVSCNGGEEETSSIEETSISEYVSNETSSEKESSEYVSIEFSSAASDVNSEVEQTSAPINVSNDTPISNEGTGGVNQGETGEGDIFDWIG